MDIGVYRDDEPGELRTGVSMDSQDDSAIVGIIKRLEVLEEERAILRMLHRYGHCIDYALPEWAELFTRDGVFDVRFREGMRHESFKLEGREALSGHIAAHYKPPAKYTKHLLIEPLIFFTGKGKATAESYWVRLDEVQGKAYVVGFGRYFDRLVKRSGRWLFRERICDVEQDSIA